MHGTGLQHPLLMVGRMTARKQVAICVAAAFAGFLASCSEPSGTQSAPSRATDAPPDVPSSLSELVRGSIVGLTEEEYVEYVSLKPFDAALENHVGLGPRDVDAAIARLNADDAIACARDQGHDVSPEVLAGRTSIYDQPITRTYGGGVQQVVQLRDTRNSEAPDNGVEIVDADAERALMQCLDEVTAARGDPLAAYRSWYRDLSSELSSRLAADPRLETVTAAEASCLESLGFPGPHPESYVTSFGQTAMDTYRQFDDGQISEVELDREIERLLRLEAVAAPQLDACVNPRLFAVRQLLNEYEADALDAHAATVAEFAADIKSRLVELGVVDG